MGEAHAPVRNVNDVPGL